MLEGAFIKAVQVNSLMLTPIWITAPNTHYTELYPISKMSRTRPFSIGLLALSLLCTVAMGALVQVTDFGANPTNLQMYINVPAKLATKPAVILAVFPAYYDVQKCG